MIATDTFYGYQSSVDTYVSGGFVDLGWNFAFILMFYAGLYQAVASKYYKEDSAGANQKSIICSKKNFTVFTLYAIFMGCRGILFVKGRITILSLLSIQMYYFLVLVSLSDWWSFGKFLH